MRNILLAIAAVVMMGTYTVLISWIVIEKRKIRQERQERAGLQQALRARRLLDLSDKPYMMPKQEERPEIKVIQGKREPLAFPSGWRD